METLQVGQVGCLDHGEIKARVVNLEYWKDRTDVRLNEGEIRMDELSIGRTENANEIKHLCQAVQETNAAIRQTSKETRESINILMDRLESWVKWGIGSALTVTGLAIAVFQIFR